MKYKPVMDLVKEIGAVDAGTPHQLRHASRMELHVLCDVVHFTYQMCKYQLPMVRLTKVIV